MKRVFISYPYSDYPERRMAEVNKLMVRLHKKYPDVLFVVPHMAFSYINEESKYREEIMCMCFDMIVLCDELWSFGNSAGCKEEIRAAKAADVKVIKKGV